MSGRVTSDREDGSEVRSSCARSMPRSCTTGRRRGDSRLSFDEKVSKWKGVNGRSPYPEIGDQYLYLWGWLGSTTVDNGHWYLTRRSHVGNRPVRPMRRGSVRPESCGAVSTCTVPCGTEPVGGTSPASSTSFRVDQMSGHVPRRLPAGNSRLMLEYSLSIWYVVHVVSSSGEFVVPSLLHEVKLN